MKKQIKAHPRITLLLVVIIALAVLVLIGGYKYSWAWTGFTGDKETYKTLYDWMQLLFIPVVLAVAGFWFNHRERKAAELRAEADREIEQKRADAEQELTLDNQREAALQEYLNEISELLLHEGLLGSDLKKEVQEIARIQTLTVLNRLDGNRKGSVIRFLYNAGLIDIENTIIHLSGANLGGVNLSESYLNGVNLFKADLNRANLKQVHLGYISFDKHIDDDERYDDKGADLHGANLSGADLSGAEIIKTKLDNANLSGANLSRAYLYSVDLRGAKLNGADLSGADLEFVLVDEANLSQANMNGVKLRNLNLRDPDLSNTFLDIDDYPLDL